MQLGAARRGFPPLRGDVFNDLKGAAKVFQQTCRSNPETPFLAQKRSLSHQCRSRAAVKLEIFP